MNGNLISCLNFYQNIKSRRRTTFQHSFLGTSPSRFLIREGHRFNASNKIGKCWIQEQILERISMRSANQLNPTLGDCSSSCRFQFATYFINDNNLRIMIFDCLDHNLMLKRWFSHLHPPGTSNCGMRYITITTNLIRSIYNYDASVLCEDSCRFSKHGGFSNAGSSKYQQAFTTFNQVFNDVCCAVNSSSYPTCESNHITSSISYS